MKTRQCIFLFGIAVTILAITAACKNPFLPGPKDKNIDLGESFTININIDPKDRTDGDSVTAEPEYGMDGDVITISYTLANAAKNNRLVFSLKNKKIKQIDTVDSDISDIFEYTINKNDADDGVINIDAVFTHTNPDPDPYTINIIPEGDVLGDEVTATPLSGIAGAIITIDYTLADTKYNNRLAFSGTAETITAVTSPGTGTKQYAIDPADAGGEGNITIYAVFTHTDKQIDTIAFADSKNENKTYGDGTFTKAITNSGEGTGAISYSSSDTSVATVNGSTGAVTILKVGETTITAKKAADDDYEETDAFYDLSVAPLQLTVSGTNVTQIKTYDGNTTATVTNAGTLGNRVGSDTVTVSAVATYNNANAGTGKIITVVYSISGTSSSNYIKPANQTFTGTISQRQLTISGTTVTQTKTYNGNTTATVISAGTLGNTVAGDTVNVSAVATYDTASAGTGKTITIVYTISGASSANYIKPANSTTSGNIDKAIGGTLASIPTASSKTASAITVNAISPPTTGQTVEYAIATTSTPTPLSGWQDSVTFNSLVSNTDYYVFARAKENTNYNAGAVRVSAAIRTDRNTTAVPHVIVFEGFYDEEINLQATGGVEIRRGDNLTVTVNGSYDSYTWYADGAKQSGTSNSITITIASNATIGEHQIMALVEKDGVSYSKQLIFSVGY